MRFEIGLEAHERADYRWKQEWRAWFAWHPVRVDKTHAAWWEWIERKQICWNAKPDDPLRYYVYRLPQRTT